MKTSTSGLRQIVSYFYWYNTKELTEILFSSHLSISTATANAFVVFTTAVDFFNEISLIWGIVCELGIPKCPVGEGFPEGFEYRWADGDKITTPIRCSGPHYVDYVLTWVEEKLNDGVTFPSTTGTHFSHECDTELLMK